MYRVKVLFTDLEDNGHLYNVGDVYPREGLTTTEVRIGALSTKVNKRGIPLIEKVEVEQKGKKGKHD